MSTRQVPADRFFANGLATELFPEVHPPHRHVAAAVRRYHSAPVDLRSNFGVWKLAAMPLRKAGEIGWRGVQRWRHWPVAPPIHTVARTRSTAQNIVGRH